MTEGTVGEGARSCDLVVRNGYVLTADAARTKYPDGAIAIDGRDIVAVGPDAEIAADFRPRRVIDAGGGLVHPGVIDTHYHGTAHLVSKMVAELEGIAEDPGPWVARQYTGLFNAVGDEEEYASALLAGLDMLGSGITAYMDPGTAHEPDAIASACAALGTRASVAAPWIMDLRGPQLADIARAPIDPARAMAEHANQLWRNDDADSLVRGHVAIYGMGSATDELALAAKASADAAHAIFTMHQSQSVDDTEFDDARYGRHPLVHFAEIGLLDERGLFVHMNVLREDEIEPVVSSGISIVWSPTNSWYYGTRRQAPNHLPALWHRGVNVTIGTDVSKAAAFGDQLYTAYVLARDQGDYLSPEDLLEMQTRGGARAFGLGDRLGSLEVGKRADLVIRRTDLAEVWPRFNIERQQLLLARSRSVDTVIVDGRVVLKGGRHTLLDDGAVYARAQAAAERMWARVNG